MNTRSYNQQLALSIRRNTGLEEATTNDPGFSCQGKVGEFIGHYLRCEVFSTKLQHFYQTDKKNKQTGLNTKFLGEALTHFNLHFDSDVLIRLFQGGSGKRGKKSARQLRNGYLHKLSKSDKEEITTNSKSFIKQMKQFLNLRIKI